MRPFIGPVHDLLVGPFEIECIDEGLPQMLILQFFPSRIEEPTLRARGGIVWNNIALDVPLADRREVVACRPSPRCKFFPEQIAFGSKSLEGNFAIAVIFIAHDVEIVLPACDRQVGTPPVFHARTRYGGRARNLRPCKGRCRAVPRAWFRRTDGQYNSCARRSGVQPQTAARRELDGPRNVSRRSRHRPLPRRRSRAAVAGRLGGPCP